MKTRDQPIYTHNEEHAFPSLTAVLRMTNVWHLVLSYTSNASLPWTLSTPVIWDIKDPAGTAILFDFAKKIRFCYLFSTKISSQVLNHDKQWN